MNNSEIININGPFKGEIEVPGDKSMTHRAIMLASLAKGISTIYEPLMGEDCRRTMDIFKLLGVTIDQDIKISQRHTKFSILVILVLLHDYLLVF